MTEPDRPVANVAALKSQLMEQKRALARSLQDAKAQGIEKATAAQEGAMADIRALQDRILDAEDDARRAGTHNKTFTHIRSQGAKNVNAGLTHISEPLTYSKHNATERSYTLDLVRVSMGLDGTGEARQRLAAHATDIATAPEYRDLSRVDGAGGYAVPPAWLVDQYIELARPGKAFASAVQNLPLPGGTDSINIPKMKTGTSVDVQTADNTQVAETDLTDDFINAPVRTLAGQQSLAIQLLDQSPAAFDAIVFSDLIAAHATKLDQQVINGSGVAGQMQGVMGTTGVQSITPTGNTVKAVYAALANAVQQIHSSRFLPPTVIVMHPRRWGWMLAQMDTTDRPLFLPQANNPQNAAGILSQVASEAVVGQMHGLPVVTDSNIPTNLGAGTEDAIFVMRASDLVLYTGGIRTRVLPETKAGTLTVLLQVYSYAAFSAARYPQSVVTISGLTAPTF